MVESDISSEIYNGNNSTVTPYPIPYYFFHDEDLLVTSINTLGTETVLQLNTDYIVTGAGNQNGGSLKTTFELPINWKLRVERIVEPTQLTSYQEGDSFPAKSHEQALDKLTMICQQNARAGGLGAGGGGKAWADDAERVLTTPNVIGQLGFQINTATIYYAQSMTTGDWKTAVFDNTSAAFGQVATFSTHTHLTNQVLDGVATLAGGVLGATPRPAGNLVGTTEVQTLTNKTLNGVQLVAPTGITKADVGLSNVDNTSDATKNSAIATLSNKTLSSPVINSPTGLVPANVGLGNVDNTSDVNKPVSTAQATALALKEDKVNKGQPSGYASLDSTSKVPLIQLPESVLGANVYQGTWNAATNTPTIPAASLANKGYYYVVNVAGTTNIDGTNSWAPGDWIISNGTIWQKVANIDSVTSVNGKTGIVVVTQGDVGLGNVNNTADSAKPVSTAQQTALNLKEDKANKGVASGYAGLDGTGKVPAAQLPPDAVTSVATKTGAVTLVKADVGLANVDNTSDATQNAAAVTLTNKTISGANNTLTVRLANDVTGNLPVTNLNGGASAGIGTFWRGDGQWGTPAGGGDVTGPAGAIDGEIALFSGTTGKLLKRAPAGAVVQMVEATLTTELLTVIAQPAQPLTASNGDPLLSAAITPYYSNSKIRITANGSVNLFKTGGGTGVGNVWLCASGTTNWLVDVWLYGYSDNAIVPWILELTHTPGAGARTYSLRMSTGAPSGMSMYMNGFGFIAGGSKSRVTLTLQEIKQ